MDVKKLAEISGEGGRRSLAVEELISLPWSEAFRISLKNVILRLGRAAITGTGIVLGIAFLTYVAADAVFSDGVKRAKAQQEQTLATATESVKGAPLAGAMGSATEQDQATTKKQEAASDQERSARRMWLVTMALLVCGIGITNSMLMSVTERFQEIGTMKCLGALDSFVVRLFLIEAAVIGFLGSFVGLLVGFIFVLAYYTITAGLSVVAKVDWPLLLLYMLGALLIGAVLSLAAAIPPAIRASHMPPAAALRSEI
jgi:predicted lysophospholipase L1 biosynthesis ABC-type transport system permease subunit